MARPGPHCLYCGAALGGAAVSAARASSFLDEATGAERRLVVVGLEGASDARAAAALGLARFDAAQRARRGGLLLHRAAALDEAEHEAARLRAAGLEAWAVPEAEARAAGRALRALGGRAQGDTLVLRTAEGALTVRGPDVLLVVLGPIAREYQSGGEPKRLRTATLDSGYRIHLHRVAEPRPVELDPGSFTFDEPARAGSSLLRLREWLAAVLAGVPVDDGFRREPPAFGLAEEDEGPASAARALPGSARSGRRARNERAVLDNVRQFRFYSGWRAAAERRRRG